PALFGVLGLPLSYVLARRLLAARAAGLGAVFVLALSPFHVSYSQDLTMYSLLFAMLALSTYALVRALRPSRGWPAGWRAWALYALLALLTVHTHYYAVFAVAAQGLFVLLCARRAVVPWAAAQLAVAAGFLPWVYRHYQLLAGQAVDQVQDLSLANLGHILSQGALGFTVGSTLPTQDAWAGWLFSLLALAALAALLARSPTRWAGALLGLGLLLPPLLVWVFDIWLQHFGERFVSMSFPPLVVLLGALAWPGLFAGLGRRPSPGQAPPARVLAPWPKFLAAAAALGYLLTSAASLRAWYFDPANLKSYYGAMLDLIAAHAQPGDVLLLDGPQQAILFQIYRPPALDYAFISPDSLISAEAAARDLPALVAGHGRAWLVLHGAPAAYDPDHRAEAWLGQTGYKAFYQSYPGNYVTLYALNAPGQPDLTAADAPFAGGPRLAAYAFGPAVVSPGGVLYLTLQWQTDAPLAVDYTVFTHVLDADGQVLAQSDSQPVSGTRPTSGWAPGETISDRYALLLPTDAPPGQYLVQAGLYDWSTGQRLLLAGAGRPASDALILGTIRLTP
ncbi:MAG: glycosyltransferase family 39 protein, partial [Anaerolineales bacterium]|nr:glycosyltransferase family 39 protein [Anaerolineales bacterium]